MKHSEINQFKVGDTVNYKNEFGEVNLKLVTNFLPVGSFSSQDEIVKSKMFSLEDSEKIALITGNAGIQLGINSKTGDSFVLVHNSPGTAALCEAEIVSFQCEYDTPGEQIEALYNPEQEYANILVNRI